MSDTSSKKSLILGSVLIIVGNFFIIQVFIMMISIPYYVDFLIKYGLLMVFVVIGMALFLKGLKKIMDNIVEINEKSGPRFILIASVLFAAGFIILTLIIKIRVMLGFLIWSIIGYLILNLAIVLFLVGLKKLGKIKFK